MEAVARGGWVGAAAAWAVLATVHAALSAAVPRGALADPLLPLWARLSLVATEWAALAAAVGAGAAALGGLRGRLREGIRRALRDGAAALFVLGLAASWSMFRLSGRFLDGEGLAFAGTNLGAVLRYAHETQPFELYILPWLLVAAAVGACEGGARLARLLPARATLGAAGVAVGLAVLSAVAGETASRWGDEIVRDPATGIAYSTGELYRLRRADRAGPLTHLVAAHFPRRDALGEPPPDAPVRIVRRPVVPMERYLAGVDLSSVRRWNVVVALVDSLRADRLAAGGSPREIMPAVEALAREGRVFTECYTQASHTDYAVPCVFSSHYPLRAREPYRYPDDPPWARVLVYDLLKALGYRTAIFSSQNEGWGRMDRYLRTPGLEVYFDARRRGGIVPTAAIDDRETVDEAIRWVEGLGEAPFFLALNLHAPHLPYTIPPDFPRRFGPREIDFPLTIGWFPPEKTEAVKGLYEDALAYADAQLGRLFAVLRGRGLWERTVVVVCGDHGEGFYEHGLAAHANSVYEEVMRVPLVLRAPGLASGTDGRPAQLLDVPPTLCDLLGLPAHPSFQGTSLVAAGVRPERSRYLLSDTAWTTHLGIVRSGLKLIYDSREGRMALYDLRRDPGEREDVFSARPREAEDLRARLAAFRRAQLDYYSNGLRHRSEYPPILEE